MWIHDEIYLRELSAYYQQQNILNYLIQGLLKSWIESARKLQTKMTNLRLKIFPKRCLFFINSSWCANCCCIVRIFDNGMKIKTPILINALVSLSPTSLVLSTCNLPLAFLHNRSFCQTNALLLSVFRILFRIKSFGKGMFHGFIEYQPICPNSRN